MANENVVLKVLFDTSEAVSSAKNLDKVMQTTSKATDDLNVSLNTTQKELSEFDKNVKGGADGLKNLAQAKKQFNDISIASSTKEVKDLANELQNVLMKDKEFMKVAGEVAKAVEKGAISNAQAFEILEDAINKGVSSVKELSNRTEDMTKKTMSFKQEMRQLTELINSGKLKGDELVIAKQRLADMKDQAGDLSAQTKILGSDTRALDTAMQGLSLGVGIFASLQGASALFGGENEKIQQALLKVNGAMAVLQGLQQIQNTLDKESGFIISVKAYATSAYGVALRVVTAIQTAFGVSSATAWAIATGGITLLITAIGLLIYNYKEVTKYVTDFLGITKTLTAQQKQQKQFAEDYINIQKQVVENGSKEIANVISLGIAIKDQKLSNEERIKAVERYNLVADESNKIDITQINNSKLVEEAIKRQTDLLIKRALVKASESEVNKIAENILRIQIELENEKGFIRDKANLTEEQRLKSLAQSYGVINGLNSADFQTQESTINFLKEKDRLERARVVQLQQQRVLEEDRIRKIVETSAIANAELDKIQGKGGGGIKTKTTKVQTDKLDVKATAMQINADVVDGVAIESELQEAIKGFDLILPLSADFSVDEALKATETIKQAFTQATSNIGGDFSGVFGNLGNITASLFDVDTLIKGIKTQKNIISLAYSDLNAFKSEFNSKMIQANAQLAKAEKSGNEDRIKEAKASVEELKKEYETGLNTQTKNIKDQESKLLSLEDGLKKASGQIAKYVGDIFLGFTQIISNSIDRNIANLDKLIEKQKVNVAEAKQIADKGNSQLYDAELKKEAKLEELRREQARKKKAIAIAEILINNAVGIANIWAQWGSQAPAGPIIAGVLTGLLAALTAVQIGVVSSQQFRKGGKVPTGMMKGASHEQGGIKFGVQGRNELYEMEGDEFIFNRETSLKNQKWFDKINNEKIDLDNLLASVRLDSMQLNPILSTTFVNQNGQLEDRLKQVEKAIIDLPNRMPQASFNADSRGLSFRMKQIIDKENAWKR